VLGTAMEHTRAIDLNIDAWLEFLFRILSLKDMPFHRLKREKNLLDLPCLDGMLTEHKPPRRRMVVRLKVEHEDLETCQRSHEKLVLEEDDR
jgi:hypothetical protein